MFKTLNSTNLVLCILGAALLLDLAGIVALSLGINADATNPRPIPQVLELVAVTTVTGMLALLSRSPQDQPPARRRDDVGLS